MTVPWGAGVAIAALSLSFVLYALAGSAFAITARTFYQNHRLLFSVVSYQFLTLGVVICVITLIFARFHTGPVSLGFRFPGWSQLLAAALFMVGLIIVGTALLYLIFNTFLPDYHLQGNTKELLQGTRRHVPLIQQAVVFVWAAVEAPFTEEVLFRGIIFQGLRQVLSDHLPYGGAVLAGAVISGLLFGLVHGQPHTLPILAFVGIVLAYVFQLTRSIYSAMVVHGIINAVAVISTFHTS